MIDLAPGVRFGRYTIQRRIGAGGMGEVFEAVHIDLQKRVALKVLHDMQAIDKTTVQRFVFEARAASRLQHPNVISVSDVGIEEGRPYMVMELLEGESLFERLRAGAMSLEQTVAIALPLLSAVAAAHDAGILHRDLKPENVMLARVGRGERPTLLDFGISQVVGPSARRLTRAGRAVGTPQYMSPEQFASRGDLDGRADQFALGVMLYECATGQLPYPQEGFADLVQAVGRGNARPPSDLRSELPAAFDELVLRSLRPRAEDRFPAVRDLGRALWPYGSLVTQAVWVEEFGDRSELAERMSQLPERSSGEPGRRSSSEPGRVSSNAGAAARPTRERLSAQSLRAFSAFEECREEPLEELARAMVLHRFTAGERLIDQGAHAHGCFLLLAGEVEVVKETRTRGAGAGRFVLATLGPGCVFGTIALLDHVPRTASVIGARAGEVAEISRAQFERLLAEKSEAAHHFRMQVAIATVRQLRRATRRLAQLLDDRGVPTGDLAYLQAAAQEPSVPLPDGERST